MRMTDPVIYILMLIIRFEMCERLAEAVWEEGADAHPSDVRNWTDEKA